MTTASLIGWGARRAQAPTTWLDHVLTRLESNRYNHTSLWSAVVIVAMFLPTQPLAQLVGMVGFILIIGASITRSWARGAGERQARILIAVLVGLLAIIAAAALVGFVGPLVGVAAPLGRPVLLAVATATLLGVVALSLAREVDPLREVLGHLNSRLTLWAGVLAVGPFVALWASSTLNNNESDKLAVLGGVLSILMALAAIMMRQNAWGPTRIQLVVASLMTSLWAVPFRGGWLDGYDIQHEFSVASMALEQLKFPLSVLPHHATDAYMGMLSITVWPVLLHNLFGLGLRSIFILLPSGVLALALMAIWSTLRNFVDERKCAMITVIFILATGPVLRQLVEVSRQTYGLAYFCLMLFALASVDMAIVARRLLLIIGAFGAAVNHYSTAYLAAVTLSGVIATSVLAGAKNSRTRTGPRGHGMGIAAIASVGVVALWSVYVAKSTSGVFQLLGSLRKKGLNLLPGKGGILSKWLGGASINAVGTPQSYHQSLLHQRHTTYSWMHVIAQASRVSIVNVNEAVNKGVHVLGPLSPTAVALVAQLVVLAAFASVVLTGRVAHRDRRVWAVAGMGLAAVTISLLARMSQTIALQFGPSRVQAQMYLLFAITVGIGLGYLQLRTRLGRRIARSPHLSRLFILAFAGIALTGLLESTQLITFWEAGTSPTPIFSNAGQLSQRLTTPSDFQAATWLGSNVPATDVVQSDLYGELALYDVGYATRSNFFAVIDPVVVDNNSWVYADQANITDGVARDGNGVIDDIYQFPRAYFTSTRAVLYTSRNDVVFGPAAPESVLTTNTKAAT